MNTIRAVVKRETGCFVVYATCEGCDDDAMRNFRFDMNRPYVEQVNAELRADCYAEGFNKAVQLLT